MSDAIPDQEALQGATAPDRQEDLSGAFEDHREQQILSEAEQIRAELLEGLGPDPAAPQPAAAEGEVTSDLTPSQQAGFGGLRDEVARYETLIEIARQEKLGQPVEDTLQASLQAAQERLAAAPAELEAKLEEKRAVIEAAQREGYDAETLQMLALDLERTARRARGETVPTLPEKVEQGAASVLLGVRDFIEQDFLKTGVQGLIVEPITDFASAVDDIAAATGLHEHLGKLAEMAPPIERAPGEPEPDPTVQPLGLPETIERILLEPPTTVTGEIGKDLLSFSVFFVPMLGQMKQITRGMKIGKAGQTIIEGAVAGGGADFITLAPSENFLAALLEQYPQLESPVTEWMAGTEDRSNLVRRLKGMIPGVALGVFADSLLALRAARMTNRALEFEAPMIGPAMSAEDRVAQQAALEGGPRVEVAEDLVRIGNPDDPIFQMRPADLDTAIEGSRGDRLFVNLERIEGPDSVKELMEGATGVFRDRLDEARRGVRSHEETRAAAESLGLSVEDVIARRRAAGFDESVLALSAEEALAFRQVWVSAASQLETFMRAAADYNAGPLDQLRFRRALAAYQAISESVLGARAETARALNAWKIPAGSDADRARQIQQLVDRMGGTEVTQAMAVSMAHALDLGASTGQLSVMARKGMGAATMDAVKESFVLGMLWKPGTHVKNMIANTIVPWVSIAERGFAEGMNAAVGRPLAEGVTAGETLALYRGMIEGYKAAFSLDPGQAADLTMEMMRGSGVDVADFLPSQLAKADARITQEAQRRVLDAHPRMQPGSQRFNKLMGEQREIVRREMMEGEFLQEQMQGTGLFRRSKVDDDVATRAISSEAFGLDPNGGLGKALDLLGPAVRAPGTALEAEDAIFKSVGYAMGLHAEAHRTAVREVMGEAPENFLRHPTPEQLQAIADRYSSILANPPPHVKLAAVDNGLYQTFQNDVGKWGRALINLRSSVYPSMVAIPFVRTPANLFRYGFERIPGVNLMVGQWREDFRAGGARRDLALAKMGVGAMATSIMLDLAYNNVIHGTMPPDRPGTREALQRQGIQPESITIDAWGYSAQINAIEPFGLQAVAVTNFADLMRKYEMSEEDLPAISEVVGAMVAANAMLIPNKTWMQGFQNVIEAMEHPDRRGPLFLERTFQSFIPFQSGLRAIQEMDSVTRPDPSGYWEQIIALVPELEDRLIRRMDLWGRPIEIDKVNVFSPARLDEIERTPIDTEIARHDMDIRRIPKVDQWSMGGVSFNVNFRKFPKVYEAYVRLAGNEMKFDDTGLGAFDFLNSMVSGEQGELSELYNSDRTTGGPQGTKRVMVGRIVSGARQAARALIMHPEEATPERVPDFELREMLRSPAFDHFREQMMAKAEEMQQLRTGEAGPEPRGRIPGVGQ